MRIGPGPVFAYEWLTAARRWQPYAMRAGFVGLILVGMAMVQSGVPRSGPNQEVALSDLARLGENLYRVMTWIELTLVLLAAPAATAGAICLDRARGTLDHMLVTDLSNAEIVLGKLAARLIPVLGLIACTYPVLSLASLLGGIDPTGLIRLLAVATGCAVLGCSLAMALSIHGRRTHEVVTLAYVLILLWVMAPVLVDLLDTVGLGRSLTSPRPGGAVSPFWGIAKEGLYWSNPYILALAPPAIVNSAGAGPYLGFLGGCLAVSAALLLLATARVRRVAPRQAGRPSPGGRHRLARILARPWLPGPSMNRNPVAWREWHRTRPSLMTRIAWGFYAALGLLWVVLASRSSWQGLPDDGIAIGIMNAAQVSIGLLLLSVGAATGLAEERARGSLDVLLSTPMSTRSILAGKWWGSFRRALGVAIWPAAATAPLAWHTGSWGAYLMLIGLVLAHGAVIASLGLAAATWIGRPGRAIAACVTIHVLAVIGWPILVGIVPGLASTVGQALLTGDPPSGVLLATRATAASGFATTGRGTTRGAVFLWTSGWILVLAIVAAALFSLAAASFDGCLGRIPDEGLPRPRRPGRSSLSDAELVAMIPSTEDP